MEAIILAGGLGTRLKDSLGDVPKSLAPINGKPFLHYLLTHLSEQGCKRVIFSLGEGHEKISEYLDSTKWPFKIDKKVEKRQLGTGGAIRYAIWEADAEDVLILNGDSLFMTDYKSLFKFHKEHQADVSIALIPMDDASRYGSVEINDDGMVLSFTEKGESGKGLVNAGVYVVNRYNFLKRQMPNVFSFEDYFLAGFAKRKKYFGKKMKGYFIDIGTPESYKQAQTDFKEIFK